MPTPVSLVQPQTGAAVVLPVARLSPGRVPKEKSPSRNLLPEKSPSKDEKSPAKAEKLPAKAEKSPAKSDKSPVKAERSTAKAGRAPPKSEPSTNASSEPGDRVRSPAVSLKSMFWECVAGCFLLADVL